jgi:hypothetical protein
VFKNPYLGNYFTQESLYFLSNTIFKTFQSVECSDVKIGTYFGVSTMHGSTQKVCRLIPLVEIKEEEANIISEEQKIVANFSDATKYYKRGYVKTDNYNWNGNVGSYIGPLTRGEGLGYFYVNNTNSVFDTSLPSFEAFFVDEQSFITYEIEPNNQKIIFKLKLEDKTIKINSDVIDDNNILTFSHTIDGENFTFEETNLVDEYDTPFNAFGRIQKLRLQLLSLFLFKHADKIKADFDYIFYGVNIQALLETYIDIVNDLEENYSGIFKSLFLNENIKNILGRLSQKYDIYKLFLITEIGLDASRIELFEELKDKINPEDIGAFYDRDDKTFLMYILGEYLDTKSNKNKVLNFINDFVDKYGGDLNKLDKNDGSVLKQAVSIFKKHGDKEILELLIRKGANLNIHKTSLLHYAVFNQLYDIVMYLLDEGMDVNTKSEVFIRENDCMKSITPLELNSYVFKSFNVDRRTNFQINNLLSTRGARALRRMEDIDCVQEEENFEEYIDRMAEEIERDFEEQEETQPRNLLSEF